MWSVKSLEETPNKSCRALTASHFFLSLCYIQNPLEMKADWYSDPSHSTAVLIGRGKKDEGRQIDQLKEREKSVVASSSSKKKTTYFNKT